MTKNAVRHSRMNSAHTLQSEVVGFVVGFGRSADTNVADFLQNHARKCRNVKFQIRALKTFRHVTENQIRAARENFCLRIKPGFVERNGFVARAQVNDARISLIFAENVFIEYKLVAVTPTANVFRRIKHANVSRPAVGSLLEAVRTNFEVIRLSVIVEPL